MATTRLPPLLHVVMNRQQLFLVIGFVLILLLAVVQETCCFVVVTSDVTTATTTTTRQRSSSKSSSSKTLLGYQSSSSSLPSSSEQQQQQEQEKEIMISSRPVQPVFVMDKTAAVASSLALYTMQVLIEDIQIPPTKKQQQQQQQHPHQLPVHLVDYQEQLQEAIMNCQRESDQTDSILHIPIDVTTTGNLYMVSSDVLQQMSFVGMYLYHDDGSVNNNNNQSDNYDDGDIFKLNGIAKSAGTALTSVLEDIMSLSSSSSSSPRNEFLSVVSLDLDLFLGMLRINSLPKLPPSSEPAPHGDCYNVAMPEGGSLLMRYSFDHTNPMGGSDPLLCPTTKETLVVSPPTQPTKFRSQHLSAAYTALYGQGLSSEASAAIAASVATILGDDNGSTNTISWDMIGRTVQLSDFIRRMGTTEQDNGFMRKKYKEYGYH